MLPYVSVHDTDTCLSFFISAFIQNFVGLIDFVLIQKRRLEQNSFAVKYIMVTKLNIDGFVW